MKIALPSRPLPIAIALIAAVAIYLAWGKFSGSGLPAGLASGNGRIEAVEIDAATKTAGRTKEILANEGDLVEIGKVLARMDTVYVEA